MRTLKTGSMTMVRSMTMAMVGFAVALLAPQAEAHFSLQQPPNMAAEHNPSYAGPQKSVPCGQMDNSDPWEPNGTMTRYKPGQKITLTIKETIFHPGHYRVLIAQNMQGLPADPAVTAGSTACGSTTITANPTLPLLADGVFQHTTSFGSTPQTTDIQLPAGYTCKNCILQVVEFMSNHGLNPQGGCYYHHCANVTIEDDAPDGGTPTPVDMAMTENPPETPTMSEGCSFAAVHPQPATLWHFAPLFVLGLALRRRRRA